MKLPQILLGLIVWLASIGAAYYIGLQVTGDEPEAQPSAEQVAELDEVEEEPQEAAQDDGPREIVTSFLATSELDLDGALGQIGALTEEETRALLAEAFALPPTDYRRARMLRQLLGQLAETAPRDALAMAEEIGSLRQTEQASIAILRVWGENEPVAALAWANTELANKPLRSQSNLMLAIYRGYAVTNPRAAFTAALALPAEGSGQRRLQTNALEEIISQQVENGGLLDAKIQIELLEDGQTKNTLLTELIDAWAEFDPEAASRYVESLGEDVPTRAKTALLSEWAENDPVAAAAWLDGREIDEETLGRASTAIIREWTRYDMASSAEWLNAQPSSPALDRAVMSYTYRAAQEDPANAMTWAESIDNDWMRTRMMTHVAGSWKADDPDAFQSYLDKAELSDEQREKLESAEELHGGRRWWR